MNDADKIMQLITENFTLRQMLYQYMDDMFYPPSRKDAKKRINEISKLIGKYDTND